MVNIVKYFRSSQPVFHSNGLNIKSQKAEEGLFLDLSFLRIRRKEICVWESPYNLLSCYSNS